MKPPSSLPGRLGRWSFGVLLGLLAANASAQNIALTHSVIANGGGVSAKAQYQIEGTIGQGGAGGAFSGGAYKLGSGFWTLAVVLQSADTPLLQATLVGNDLVLSWSGDAPSFVLQSTATVAAPLSWAASPHPVVYANGQFTVTVPWTGTYQFFRLRRP